MVGTLDPVAIGAAIHVFDDVLPDASAYRALALAQSFETIQTGAETWRGIALLANDSLLPQLLAQHYPGAKTRLTFFRQSPAGQLEPNMVHSDEGHGELTAILYLNPDPPPGDGTRFWRYRPTGEVRGTARALPKDADAWEPWRLVEAKFGRVLVFDSWLFHSRAIEENYGEGADARLVQVAFLTLPHAPGIREAMEVDAPDIIQMAERFVASTSYQSVLALDRHCLAALLQGIVASPDAVCFLAEGGNGPVGMIAMTIAPHIMTGERVATEVVWWVDPEARGRQGIRLLRAAEAWARARGAAAIHMFAPDARVGRVYHALGYSVLEMAWHKRITP